MIGALFCSFITGQRHHDEVYLEQAIQQAKVNLSKKGPDYDYRVTAPAGWRLVAHGCGDRETSLWVFQIKSNIQVNLTFVGGKAMRDRIARLKADAPDPDDIPEPSDLIRRWKFGKFKMETHSDVFHDGIHMVDVRAENAKVQIDVAFVSLKTNQKELVRIATEEAQKLLTKNPDGGLPKK